MSHGLSVHVDRPLDDGQPEAALPDEAVIARVLEGDTEQFAVLVRRYQGALYRHAAAMVLDHDVAADMVQDAFVRAYRHLGTCRDRARFRAWLFQMLRNRCLDHLKEARRHDVRLDTVDAIVDRADGPATPMERAQVRAELVRALAALPDAQREALMMRCVEDVPYERMAELLGASVSALKMRVLRAREALGAALQRQHVTGAGRRSSLSTDGHARPAPGRSRNRPHELRDHAGCVVHEEAT